MNNPKASFFIMLLIIFLNIEGVSAQQYTLKGKVINQDNLSIEFVHARLLKNDSLFVRQTPTDSLGNFSFRVEKGHYFLVLEQFGQEFISKNIELVQDVDLGEIEIDESVKLEGIIITGIRKLIKHSGDKLIFDVENSLLSQGNSGIEVLQRSPKLSLGAQGNILLQNKDVIVLVNGRKLNLQGNDLTNYIANINSEDIARIEIQDISSSDQEASTNGGTVNIILKNQSKGFRLIGKSYYLYRDKNVEGYYTLANLNYGGQKWNFYSSVDYTESRDKGNSRGLFNYKDGRLMSQNGTFKQSNEYIGLRAGSVFNPNSRTEIGFEGYLNSSNSDNYLLNSLAVSSNDITEYSKSKSLTLSDNKQWYFTGNYTFTLDTLGSSIRFLADMGNARTSPENDVVSSYDNQELGSHYLNKSNSNSKYFTTQLDYVKKYNNNWELSLGIKFNRIFRENDLLGKITTNQQLDERVIEQLDFNNLENIYASYFSLSKTLGNHFLKAGIRYEHTNVEGTNKIDQKQVKQSYNRPFPTLYYKYTMDGQRAFSLAYRSGIGRPSFYDLNPFVIKQNDYLYLIGNPELRPQYNDNFYADYTFGSNTLSAYAELTTKMIHNVYYQKDDVIYYQALNYGNAQGYGINHSYSSNLNKWLYMSINSGIFYNRFKPNTINPIDGFAFYSNLFANVKLSESWMVELINNYTTPSKFRNVDMAHRYNLDAGIQKAFLDGKLLAKIKVFDIFNTIRDRNLSHYESFTYDFYQKRKSRSVMFFLQFNIDNNKKIKESKVSSDNEYRNRL